MMHASLTPSLQLPLPAPAHRPCRRRRLDVAPRGCRTTLDSRLNASPVQKDCSTAASASELRRAADGQGFGAFSTEQQQKQLLQVVANLKQLHTAPQAASAPTQGPLAGKWRLLWTSEASVHSIVKGQLLGAPVTAIQQSIDLQSKRVTNTISFGWLGLQLQASGPLTVKSPTRIYYSFDTLLLRLLQLQLPLPVFFKGGGWTDCVLLLDDGDTTLRVMENSRGDTLVLQLGV